MRLRRPSFRIQDVLQATVIALIIGWLAALGFGLWIAKLQYDEVNAYLPLEKANAAYQSRIDGELQHGPLLFLPQIGVMAAVLAWQVARRAKDANKPRLYGAATGALVAFIESVVALVMQVPWIFVVVLWILLFGTGIFADWYAER